MIYGINDGHTLTGVGTGAVGIVKETDKNRESGKRLREMLKEKGHTVINCTVDKSNNDLVDACNIANKQYLDLFISLHLNSFDKPSANGVETYSLSTTGKGAEFRNKIQAEMADRIGWYNRGCKTANFYVLKNTTAPAVLVELGFCSNKSDMDKWNTEKICKGIFKAITGTEYITNNPAPIPPSNSNEMYKVRKTWEDSASQKGAYSNLENAKKYVDENKGYYVFNNAGTSIYPTVITKDNWVSELQKELNKSYSADLIVDGIIGQKTLAACPTLKEGAKGNIVTLLQKRLISKNFTCGSYGADGSFGNGTKVAVINFQKSKSLSADGIVGKNTWNALAK